MTDSQTPQAIDQLAGVLREIAEMEAAPGFKGPKIVTSDLVACQRCDADPSGHCFEDCLTGEIGRACDALGLEFMMKSSPSGHHAIITKWRQVELDRWRPVFGSDGRGPSRALAAAIAYRDALKETMK